MAIASLGGILLFTLPASAASTGIEPYLSFEGKIVTSAGINITNGNYNMEFKIYSGGTATGGGTLEWTEDWLVSGGAGHYVSLSSGTYQVNLGSQCAFSGGSCQIYTNTAINWNTYPLYLSLQIGNTSSSCAPSATYSFSQSGSNCGGDGEMSPYILLTSTPYAMNAAELGGLVAPTTTPTASQCLQTAATVPYTQLVLGSCGSGGASTLQQTYTASTGGSPLIKLSSAIGGFSIQDASSTIGANLLQVNNYLAATLFSVGNAGNLTVATSTNSSTALQIQNASGATVLSASTTTNTLNINGSLNLNQIANPTTAPTLGSFSSGSLPANTYYYVVTYVTASGQTGYGPALTVNDTTANQEVNLTAIPVSPSNLVTARDIYRSTTSYWPYNYELVGTISNNTATTYTDNNTSPSAPIVSDINQTAQFQVNGSAVLIIDSVNDNLGLGSGVLQGNTIGSNNTAIGIQALQDNTTGLNNTGLGDLALDLDTTGGDNLAIGQSSLGSNITGNYDTAVGDNSIGSNITGNYNSAVGDQALGANIGGSYNTAIGYEAGDVDSSNYFDTSAALQDATAIGAYAQVQASDSIVLGSVDTLTNVGIGTTIPLNTFSVSPMIYNTGTACSVASSGSSTCSGTSTVYLYGSGTTWTASMVGDELIFADGSESIISAVTSSTAITLAAAVNEATGSYYRIHVIGLQVTSSGNTYVQNNSTTGFQVENNYGSAILGVNTSTPAVQVTGSLTASTGTFSDGALIQDTGAGTDLTVDNNLGIPIITAGTNNLLINGDFEGSTGTSGWSGATAGGTIALNTNPSNVYSGAASLAVTTTTTTLTGAQVTSFNNPMAAGTYTITFEAMAPTSFATMEVLFGSTACLSGATVTTSFSSFSCTITTSSTTSSISIVSTGTTAHTFYVDAVDVLLTPNLLSNPGFESGTTGWSATNSASIAWNQNRFYVYMGMASLKVTTSSTASSGTQDSTFISAPPSGSVTYDLTFYAMATSAFSTLGASIGGTSCTLNSNTVSVYGFTEYSCSATTSSSPTVAIFSTGTTANIVFYVDAVQLAVGSSAMPYNIGQIQLRGVINNPVVFQGTSNSTSAFQINNGAGNTMFNINTANNSTQLNTSLSDLSENISDNAAIQDAGYSTALSVNNAIGEPLDVDSSNNLLLNGDFEANTTGWAASGTGAAIAQNSNPTYVYSGASSLAITIGSTTNTGADVTTFNSGNSSNALPAGTYILSFYAKAAGTFTSLAAAFSNTIGTNACTLNSATVSTSAFTYYSCPYTASAAVTAITIGSSTASAPMLYIDAVRVVSESNTNLLANPGFETGTTGWSATATASASIAWNQNKAYTYDGQTSLAVTTGTADGGAQDSTFIATIPAISSTAYDLSFYAMIPTGTFTNLSATVGGTACLTNATVLTTGFTEYNCTATTSNAPAIVINSSTTTSLVFYLDAVQLTLGASVQPYNIGQIQLRGVVTNPIQFQSVTNSTTALQVQNASGASIFTADTVDSRIILGVAGSTPVELVLGIKNTTSDPTGNPCSPLGAIYYNSYSGVNEFRACRYIGGTGTGENDQNTWVNLIAGVDVQIFTSNGTWTAPYGISTVVVDLCGGGGSGGGGRGAAAGSARQGGTGGGGGTYVSRTFYATDVGSTVSVTVGAQTTGGASGTAGSVGNPSSFGTFAKAAGGGAGAAGPSTSANTAGGTGAGLVTNGVLGTTSSANGADTPSGYTTTAPAAGFGWSGGGVTTGGVGMQAQYGGGGGGGTGTGLGVGSNGGDSVYGGGGGGGGGSVTAASPGTASTGGAGGGTGTYSNGGAANANAAGAVGNSTHCGTGGGGGLSVNSATGNVGGAGGLPGGGGGGGGGGTSTGGAGGVGAAGEVWVFSW